MYLKGDSVVGAVIRQLRKSFPDWKCYKEDQDQALVRPCFFVKQLSLQSDKQMNMRYRRAYRIQIQALPSRGDAIVESTLRQVGEDLLGVFRILHLSDVDREFGKNAEFKIVDRTLIFTVEFSMTVVQETESGQKMETLDIQNVRRK